nr:protein kinase-like domain, phloem protein 2-like protein [Tanacetum cinerariifolium]
MSLVVEQLNFALELQGDQHTFGKYREIIKAAVDPLIFTSLEQLKALLSKGVFL